MTLARSLVYFAVFYVVTALFVVLGSWLFVGATFASAYLVAPLLRRLWR